MILLHRRSGAQFVLALLITTSLLPIVPPAVAAQEETQSVSEEGPVEQTLQPVEPPPASAPPSTPPGLTVQPPPGPPALPPSRASTDPRMDVPPEAPSGLIAMPLESLQIHLLWRDNSNNEKGFRISGGPDYIATVEPNNPEYVSEFLPPGATRCYRVQAYNDSGGSSWTEPACATTRIRPTLPGSRFYPPAYPRVRPQLPTLLTPPDAPRGLRARALNHNTIRLDWTNSSDSEIGLMIEGGGGFYTVRAGTSTTNAGGLLPGTNYCFKVGAYNELGEAWSNEACATTPTLAP